jgi:hypothetical protein
MDNIIVNNISVNAQHLFTNMEFTGVIVKSELCPWNNITNSLDRIKQTYLFDYHLFIKCGDKVYIDVLSIGEIVITFDELQKNQYLKHYYDLSLMISNNKNIVIERTKYKNDEPFLYREDRLWGFDSAFVEATYKNDETLEQEYKIAGNQQLYYYKINPYDLENIPYSSQVEFYEFQKKNMDKKFDKFWGGLFEQTHVLYKNLIIDYNKQIMRK